MVGRYFEELEIGESFEGPGRTITETDIVQFAGLSGDWNSVHTDAEAAGQGMFGQRVAHGLLVLSIASGLAMRMGLIEGSVKAFLGLDWKFRNPVFIGDTIRLKAVVSKKREMRRLGGGLAIFHMEVLNQQGKVVQQGEWEVLVVSLPE